MRDFGINEALRTLGFLQRKDLRSSIHPSNTESGQHSRSSSKIIDMDQMLKKYRPVFVVLSILAVIALLAGSIIPGLFI